MRSGAVAGRAAEVPALAADHPALAGNLPAPAAEDPALAGKVLALAVDGSLLAGKVPALAMEHPAKAMNSRADDRAAQDRLARVYGVLRFGERKHFVSVGSGDCLHGGLPMV
jgi:hypothetical protein